MANPITWAMAAGFGLGLAACQGEPAKGGASAPAAADTPIENKLAQYITVRLTTDLGKLTDNERRMLPLLIDAAASMDAIFWRQAYGNRDSLLRSIPDPAVQRYGNINYGPWDRLADNAPFVEGVGAKPKGAGFYPHNMTKEELEAAARKSPVAAKALRSQYTIVRRDSPGGLVAIPYHQAYADLQGDGDYAGVTRFMAERGKLSTQLQEDLARLGSKGIPVDIVFDQGPGELQ